MCVNGFVLWVYCNVYVFGDASMANECLGFAHGFLLSSTMKAQACRHASHDEITVGKFD